MKLFFLFTALFVALSSVCLLPALASPIPQLHPTSYSTLSSRSITSAAEDAYGKTSGAYFTARRRDAVVLARGKDKGGKSTEVWGKGSYKMDMNDYHRNLKPLLIKGFEAKGIKLPGRNPDFEIDRDGNVRASATGGKASSAKNTAVNISELVPGFKFGRRSLSRASLVARGKDKGGSSSSATWGQGKYTMDLNDYHKNLKPQLIKGFQAQGVKLPGKNPDFNIDRKGYVQASATGGKAITTKNPAIHIDELVPDHNLG